MAKSITHDEPTYANQLWHARKLLAEKGAEAVNNPHAMIGRTCGCKDCFCCAAAEVYAETKQPATLVPTDSK